MLVEHVLLVIFHHPFSQNGAAAAYDSGDALGGEWNILHQHSGVDGHIIHTLLRLLFDDFEHHAGREIFHAAHTSERFVNRHGANRDWRGVDDGLTNTRDVAAGGKIHHGIAAVLHRILELGKFLVDLRRHRGVPDVGVDFASAGHPYAHRLEVDVVDIGRNDHAPARHLRPD